VYLCRIFAGQAFISAACFAAARESNRVPKSKKTIAGQAVSFHGAACCHARLNATGRLGSKFRFHGSSANENRRHSFTNTGGYITFIFLLPYKPACGAMYQTGVWLLEEHPQSRQGELIRIANTLFLSCLTLR